MSQSIRFSLLLLCTVCFGTGCRVFDINLIGLEPPVRTALVTDRVEELLNPQLTYNPLLLAMRQQLGRPVGLEPAFTHQAEPLLLEGHFKLAIATPGQYAQFDTLDESDVMVMPAPKEGPASRPAVLIVKADSEYTTVADLREKRIAFGQKNNARTYFAALALLDESGISPEEIKRGLLLLGTLWRHQSSAVGRTQSLLDGHVDAAFVDKAEWNRFPKEEERAGEPCHDKLRIIAETVSVPDRIWLASPALDDATRAEIETFLLEAGEKNPDELAWLEVGSFQRVDPKTLENCRKLTRVEPTLLEALAGSSE